MNKAVFSYYWLAFTVTNKLFWLLLPVIFVATHWFIPYIIFATSLGWTLILFAFFYRCPSCNKRALIHYGHVPKKIESDRNWFSKWLVPDEYIYQYFHCCKCGHKIEAM